jgi:hypothetical protein
MDEEATFEARAVLAPKRRRVSRFALAVPAVALAAIAATGLIGPHERRAITELVPPPTPLVSPSPRPQHPSTVLGLPVQRLDALRPLALDPDHELAVAGWYSTTAITGCPPLAAIYRDGALPYLRGDSDKLAFCVRSGMLYAAEPVPGLPQPTTAPRQGPAADPTMSVVAVTVAIGVVMPQDMEVIGASSTEIVVLGRFVPRRAGCVFLGGCGRDFVVDYVAWTPGGSA